MDCWSLQKLIFCFQVRYPQFWNTVILANVCKTNIFSVNSGVFDTRLKIFDTSTAGGAGDKYQVWI